MQQQPPMNNSQGITSAHLENINRIAQGNRHGNPFESVQVAPV